MIVAPRHLLSQIRRNMLREHPESHDALAALFVFGAEPTPAGDDAGAAAAAAAAAAQLPVTADGSGAGNHLQLRSSAPLFVYSTAPLTLADGR